MDIVPAWLALISQEITSSCGTASGCADGLITVSWLLPLKTAGTPLTSGEAKRLKYLPMKSKVLQMLIIVIRKAILFGVEGMICSLFCLPLSPHPASSFKSQLKAQGHGQMQWG